MASDHVRGNHIFGFNAVCPGCKESCFCGGAGTPDRKCVKCALVEIDDKNRERRERREVERALWTLR